MPEKPTPSDVIYQEGNEVLKFQDGEYALTTFVEGKGNVYSDRITVAYGLTEGKNRLLNVRFKHHPRGINPYTDVREGETYLARLNYLNRVDDYLFDASYLSQFDHNKARDFLHNPYCLQSDVGFRYFRSAEGGYALRALRVNLPLLSDVGENNNRDRCFLACSIGSSLDLWRQKGEFGGHYDVSATFEELLVRTASGSVVVVEVLARDTFVLPERVEITTKPTENDVKKLCLTRQVGENSATIELGLLLSLDAITAPPVLTNPQAVFTRMQEIKALLLKLKPIVT